MDDVPPTDELPDELVRKAVEWCAIEQYCPACDETKWTFHAPGHTLGGIKCIDCGENTKPKALSNS